MKIKLIYPSPPRTIESDYAPSKFADWFFWFSHKLSMGADIYARGKKAFHIPPLNLAYLSALVPDDLDVEIIDERIQPVDFSEPVDLVGITCLTSNAYRAYEIADKYRSLGTNVILGGHHPSVMPNEAANHADAIVIGEADNVFLNVLDDFKKNNLRKFYSSTEYISLENLPIPRRDLLDSRYYFTRNLIQTTRGCPHGCSFCSVPNVSGPHYRRRPVNDVIREVEYIGENVIGFVDDNIIGHKKYSMDLFQELVALNVNWFGDVTIQFADNEKLLKLAADSGCKIVFIGFESLSQSILNSINKKFNRTHKFVESVKRIHEYGIAVMGGFILGLDGGDKNQAERIIEFANESKIDYVSVSILTPYPGTEMFKKLDEEGRLLTYDWSSYDTTLGNVVFKPQNMTQEDLQNMQLKVMKDVYSIKSIYKRVILNSPYPQLFLPYNIRQRRKLPLKQLAMAGKHFPKS